LDLVYTQSGTLYDKIPDAPRPEFSIPPPPGSNSDSHAGDGVIGTANAKSTRDSNKKARKTSNQKANQEILASEVNAVSTDKGKNSNQPGSKKNQNKEKKKQGDSSPRKTSFGKGKPPSGCHICDEDHWTKDCPYKAEFKRFLKNSQTPAVLTDPFPNPSQNLVDNGDTSRCQVLMVSTSEQQKEALISTKCKNCGIRSRRTAKEMINQAVRRQLRQKLFVPPKSRLCCQQLVELILTDSNLVVFNTCGYDATITSSVSFPDPSERL
jgi:hypothetical protein